MRVHEESSRLVKPILKSGLPKATIPTQMTLNVFDLITDDAHIPIIYVYRPPTPSIAAIELGLGQALSDYRELAGRFSTDEKGQRVILLNDKGLRFVEASADCTLDEAKLFNPSKALLSLHPCLDSPKELVQVQLTRFACGSLAVAISCNHMVADGFSMSRFLIAWSQACCGDFDRNLGRMLLDRAIFMPRDPPRFQFEHKGVEFKDKNEDCTSDETLEEDLFMYKSHFTLEMLSQIKTNASQELAHNAKPHSMFVCLVAHVWRNVVKACVAAGDGNRYKATCLKISVNGRRRMSPPVPDDFVGNVVLWAYPKAGMNEILSESVSYAAKIIHEALAKLNDDYFKSYIDFASYKFDENELVPVVDFSDSDVCLNLYIDSWLGFPYCDMDFGGGMPCMFMPSYRIWPGQVFLLPSQTGDKSIDVMVTLSENQLSSYKERWFSLE
ncbi:hypothetical protein Sjap_013625 [Stephania japonica]|uniref:Uncharacterized protein n=1 Tax=Stephania japonica TaxID=461633 RepID=A0AAP0J023_9MAGN